MNNGPYCRPIELLQEYKHGARQNRLEGIEARKKKKNKDQKKSFSPQPEEKKTQPTELSISLRAGTTARARSRASSVQERCRRLSLFVFSLYFRVEKKKTGAVATTGAFSVDGCCCPAVSSQIQGSSAGRAGIIPPFTTVFSTKHY